MASDLSVAPRLELVCGASDPRLFVIRHSLGFVPLGDRDLLVEKRLVLVIPVPADREQKEIKIVPPFLDYQEIREHRDYCIR